MKRLLRDHIVEMRKALSLRDIILIYSILSLILARLTYLNNGSRSISINVSRFNGGFWIFFSLNIKANFFHSHSIR